MRGLLTLLVLVAVSGGLFALASTRRGVDAKPILNVATEVALTVRTAAPAREAIIRLVQSPGDVEAVLEVDVSSEIVAKIEEMPVEEGDIVKKGDLLCRLNDDRLRAEVDSANAYIGQLRASIDLAEADLDKARRDYDRQRSLSEANATSQLELANYHTTFKKARSAYAMRGHELEQAAASLKTIEEDLKRTIITAPISGIVSKLVAKQGEVVITGTMNNPGTVIMTISDLSKMQVRTRVDEVDVPLVKVGQKARVYLQSDPNTPVPARVVRVASKGSRPTGRDVVTFETLLEVLSTADRIKPGMTANVEVEVAQNSNAITVPIEAIVNRMRKDLPEAIVKEIDERRSKVDLSHRALQAQYHRVVYVMNGEKALVRLVDIGISDTRRVEILGGVGVDDMVITGPYRSLDQLEDGKRVALSDKDKEKANTSEDGTEETEQVAGGASDDSDANERQGKVASGG